MALHRIPLLHLLMTKVGSSEALAAIHCVLLSVVGKSNPGHHVKGCHSPRTSTTHSLVLLLLVSPWFVVSTFSGTFWDQKYRDLDLTEV